MGGINKEKQMKEKFKILKEIEFMLQNDSVEDVQSFLATQIRSCEEFEQYDFFKTILIPNPPTKYTDVKKNIIDPSTGRLKEIVYYLTANIFYAGVHFAIRSKIVENVKYYLVEYMKDIPELQKMKIEIVYSKDKTQFDLDNKVFFWLKMFLDLVKIPTERQKKKAIQYRKAILSINSLKDDTVKYIDEINMKYEPGQHQMKINIYGMTKDKGTLFQ